MTDEIEAELEEALGRLTPARARTRLAAYLRLLSAANKAQNLTAARTPAQLVEHVSDALTLVPFVREPLLDVGSGGGFPAIPLSIVTGFRATLVESNAKRARFLAAAAAELGLPLNIVAARAEDAGHEPDLRERFGSATARAVGTLPTVLELTVPFLSLGGSAVLQRGTLPEEERQAGLDAARMLGASLDGEELLGGARRIVLATKLAPTPGRFPRRSGVPRKRPLCLREPLIGNRG